MGRNIVCGTCGATVYVTDDSMPKHLRPQTVDSIGVPGYCTNHRRGQESDRVLGFDGDPWVYQGGAWEMGKHA